MAKSRTKKGKPNATGRSEGATKRFVMLPHSVLESIAYNSLDCVARGLLTVMLHQFNGKNNGQIFLSVSDAQARLGLGSNRTAARAFDDLVDTGMIRITKNCDFRTKATVNGAPRAREWRITWLPSKGAATNEWQSYIPPGETPASKRAHDALKSLSKHRKDRAQKQNAGALSALLPHETEEMGVIADALSAPVKCENDENQPVSKNALSAPHIYNTMGYGGAVVCTDHIRSVEGYSYPVHNPAKPRAVGL